MKRRILTACLLVFSAAWITACGNGKASQEAEEAANKAEAEAMAESMDEEGIDADISGAPDAQTVEEDAATADAMADEVAEDVTNAGEEALAEADEVKEEALGDITGEMDLTGSWQDELSQRATMEAVAAEDGAYDIYVEWGDSADRALIWQIHGEYDPESGMLAYEDAVSYFLTTDGEGNEKMEDQQTSHGAFMKNGDKLRWQDSRGDTECLFVKP